MAPTSRIRFRRRRLSTVEYPIFSLHNATIVVDGLGTTNESVFYANCSVFIITTCRSGIKDFALHLCDERGQEVCRFGLFNDEMKVIKRPELGSFTLVVHNAVIEMILNVNSEDRMTVPDSVEDMSKQFELFVLKCGGNLETSDAASSLEIITRLARAASETTRATHRRHRRRMSLPLPIIHFGEYRTSEAIVPQAETDLVRRAKLAETIERLSATLSNKIELGSVYLSERLRSSSHFIRNRVIRNARMNVKLPKPITASIGAAKTVSGALFNVTDGVVGIASDLAASTTVACVVPIFQLMRMTHSRVKHPIMNDIQDIAGSSFRGIGSLVQSTSSASALVLKELEDSTSSTLEYVAGKDVEQCLRDSVCIGLNSIEIAAWQRSGGTKIATKIVRKIATKSTMKSVRKSVQTMKTLRSRDGTSSTVKVNAQQRTIPPIRTRRFSMDMHPRVQRLGLSANTPVV